MAIERKAVGAPLQHRGSVIQARHMGPDLLVEVDGETLPNFYLDPTSAHKAGVRYVDDRIKAREKK